MEFELGTNTFLAWCMGRRRRGRFFFLPAVGVITILAAVTGLRGVGRTHFPNVYGLKCLLICLPLSVAGLGLTKAYGYKTLFL